MVVRVGDFSDDRRGSRKSFHFAFHGIHWAIWNFWNVWNQDVHGSPQSHLSHWSQRIKCKKGSGQINRLGDLVGDWRLRANVDLGANCN